MTKKRDAKRSLLMSGLALVLCLVMLGGSSLAWYSDVVSAEQNKIETGVMEVELLMWDGDGYDTPITESSEPIFDTDATDTSDGTVNDSTKTLWEPGKTQVAYFKLENTGSLNVKYRVNLNVTSIDKNLNEVLEYAIVPDAKMPDYATSAAALTSWEDGNPVVPGVNNTEVSNVYLPANPADPADSVDYFALYIHMDADADISYMGGSIGFDINVEVTQATSEGDAFGGGYDAGATYPNGVFVVDPIAYTATAATDNFSYTNSDGTVKVSGTTTAGSEVKVTVAPAATGAEIAKVVAGTGQSVVSYNIDVVGQEIGSTVTVELFVGKNLTNVTVYHDGVAMSTDESSANHYTYKEDTGVVTIKSASFSPFEIAYNNPATLPEGIPVAIVTNADEYENLVLEWKNVGGYYPTPGLDAYLESAYTFKAPHDGDTIDTCAFKDWYCDYYVMLDRDLGADQIFLGGNYGSFGWVGFHNGDITLAANEEIPLLGSVTSVPWTYEDVACYVGEFICGVGDVNNALEGATFTVMLRLTNPADETEFYNVNTVKYTFG